MTAAQTPRVRLRALEAADRKPFIAAMKASRGLHRPWVSPPTTPETFDALLRRAGDSFATMIVVDRESGDIAGYFQLSQIYRAAFQNAFLGYGGVAAYAGRGYMTAGLALLLRRAFADLRLHRLEANIQPANESSIALVRRAGFVREGFSERYLKIGGRWRDHERWAIRAEQWRGKQPGPN